METSHDRDLSGGRDLESASEMEAFMNEIASGPSPSDQLGDTQDGESSAETVQTAVSLTPILGRKSSDGRRRGPFAKDDAADYDEEQGTVVGRARRRSSVRRRSGAKVSEGRRDSKGILEKINDGVRAVAPELRRRSSSLMRHGRQYSTATTAAASTTSFQKARRASLLNVAMRSKAAAAAVAGCHDDEVADTEADADAADREMSKWNLEFRDPILETVGAPFVPPALLLVVDFSASFVRHLMGIVTSAGCVPHSLKNCVDGTSEYVSFEAIFARPQRHNSGILCLCQTRSVALSSPQTGSGIVVVLENFAKHVGSQRVTATFQPRPS